MIAFLQASALYVNNRLSEIRAAGAAAQAAARGNLGLGGGPNGRRNRIVNGAFEIDQVNAGAVVSVNAAAIFRSVDKWKGNGTGAAGVYSLQQQAAGFNGNKNFLRATVTTPDAAPAAGARYFISTQVEGTYCGDLQFGIAANGQFITISFKVRCSLAGQFSGSIRNNASNRSYPFLFDILAAATWTTKTITIPVDTAGAWLTNTGIGLNVSFDLGSGATFRGANDIWAASDVDGATGTTRLISTNGATFDLAEVALEAGEYASTFERALFPDELRLCQREYCKTFLISVAPVQNVGNANGAITYGTLIAAAVRHGQQFTFPVVMRATPTPTYYNTHAANTNWRNQSAGADSGASASNTISERADFITNAQVAGDGVGAIQTIHAAYDARL